MTLWSEGKQFNDDRKFELAVRSVLQPHWVRAMCSRCSSPVSGSSQDLFAAAARGEASRVAEMLSEKADINALTAGNATPLHIAAAHANVDVIRLLLNSRASLNAKNERDQTALMLAAGCANSHAAVALLAAQTDFAHESRTALHEAVSPDGADTVAALLAARASVEHRDLRTGLTAAGAAIQKYTQLLDMLRQQEQRMPYEERTSSIEEIDRVPIHALLRAGADLSVSKSSPGLISCRMLLRSV